MTIDRRDFIKGSLVAAGEVAVTTAALAPLSAEAAAPGYLTNRAPLAPASYLRLPPGAVRAQGWLDTQLRYQLNGLCGRYPEYSDFLKFGDNGWSNPSNPNGWEEVPYWLRGFIDMAYVLNDAPAISTAHRWINSILASQASDGFFGPTAMRTATNGHLDVWPHMVALHALRSFAEYTGDGRVQPFMTKFFRFVNVQPTNVLGDSWAGRRCGDMIDVIYWLYNRTGESFLLDVARRMHASSVDWINGLPDRHNVNIAQGFREPALYAVLSGDAKHRKASYDRYNEVQATWGQFPGGGFAGDENSRTGFGDPRQGFETCGIVEYMLSHEILTRITGDSVWSDRTEELAFNSLPAALDPLGRSIHYITSANSIDLNNVAKRNGQFQNGFAMQQFQQGVHNYRCCPHNYGMGWPYYVEEMWLATPDGGLCAALYGPSTVTARVGSGASITITESTSYPFADTITLRIQLSASTAFPLQLRVPGWCASPEIRVNGNAVNAGAGPRFVTVNRTWANGDVVTLKFPAQPVVKRWPNQHNAVSVNYGALSFSLQITENWVQTGGDAQWPQYDVHAGSAWNYGLVPNSSFAVSFGGNAIDPFKQANVPIKLTTSAQKIPAWQADSESVITTLQDGPVASSSPVETITLIPMGAARLRITSFPQTGGTRQWVTSSAGASFRIQNRNSGKVLGVDGMSQNNSANVVQFGDTGTSDHLWRIVDAGGGNVKVVNVNSGKLLAVENMSGADSARVQQFEDSGTPDHLWQLLDNGNGWLRLRNVNSGKVLGVSGMSLNDSVQVVQYADNGTADHDWRLIPDGQIKVQNVNSGKLLAVENMSMADSARVQQFEDSGTPDHLWTFLPNGDGSFRIRNVNSGKVLGVSGMSLNDSVQVVQFADTGTADHNWRIRVLSSGAMRLQNVNSGKVLAVHNMSGDNSANVEQFSDNGTVDHNWRLL